MQQLTGKELQMISDALTQEALICKKAKAYANTLTDPALAECMQKISDDHKMRYCKLLSLIGG